MNKKTLLVLAASRYQLETIKTAKRLGYRVVTTDNVPENPGHLLADRSYAVDTTDRQGVLQVAVRERVEGVISPCTDVAVPTAAYVAERLGLPGPPLAAADITCDKLAFRDFLQTHGLPSPRAYAVADGFVPPAEIFAAQKWVLKPTDSSGSKGVFVLSSVDDFERRLPDTLAFSPRGEGILERYLEGVQGTCEGVLENGKVAFACVFDRQTAPLPFTATRGHRLPSKLPLEIEARLIRLIEEVWRRLGVEDGPFDADFVICGEEVYLLEMSPRIGGNLIADLIRAATGFDIVEYGVRYACGEQADVPRLEEVRPVAVLLLGVEERGFLDYSRREAERLREEPWVLRLAFDVQPGASVLPFIHGRRRVGEAVVCAQDRDELDRRVDELFQRLQIRSVPLPEVSI